MYEGDALPSASRKISHECYRSVLSGERCKPEPFMKSPNGDRPGPPKPRDFFALFEDIASTFFIFCVVSPAICGVAGVANVNELSVGAGVFRVSSLMLSATRFVSGVPAAFTDVTFTLAPFSCISEAYFA